jgi:hypothetical protein
VNEDEKYKAEQEHLAAQAEWIRQSNLTYGGLAAAGLVMVQPFLTETSLDPSALVCVIAFAVGVHSSGYVQLEYGSRFRSKFRSPSRRLDG